MEKSTNPEFDVGQGAYDGAEIAELCDLFIMNKIVERNIFDKDDMSGYRDDFLIVTGTNRSEVERKKKQVTKLFKEWGFDITIEAFLEEVCYLDVKLNIVTGDYAPYLKPLAKIQYVNTRSDHPRSVIKAIPENINLRLNKLSRTKEIFETNISPYQNALTKSGYTYNLKWIENRNLVNKNKKKNKKDILYFNPPWSNIISTPIGRNFIALIRKWFESNPLLKDKFNTKKLKMSYCTMENVIAMQTRRNKRILTPNHEEPYCNCNRSNSECPIPNGLPGKNCRTKNCVYKATVKNKTTKIEKVYFGSTSTEFKERVRTHRNTFRDPRKETYTELAKEIHKINRQNQSYEIRWEIMKKTKNRQPGDKYCNLCSAEKFYILYYKFDNMLNNFKMEKCRHKRKTTL